MEYGGRTTSITDSIISQDQEVPSTTIVKRVGAGLPNLLAPERKVGKAPGSMHQLKTILFGSCLINLSFFVRFQWALEFAKPHEYTLIFVLSFLAIVPLAKLLAFATDELSIRVGERLAELLNATLVSAAEAVLQIIALWKCELRVVQSSLVGSILSKLLLVLGLCFFVGGTRFSEQGFSLSAIQVNSSLLTLSVIGVLTPVTYHMVTGSNQISGFDSETEQRHILKLSHGIAIVLLFIYASFLIFQLFSHKNLYDDKSSQRLETIKYAPRTGPDNSSHFIHSYPDDDLPQSTAEEWCSVTESDGDKEDERIPELSLPMALALLVLITVLVAVTAEGLVQSIEGLASGGVVSKEFIGLVLLPIVGNAAECAAAVTVSVQDKLASSLVATVGSSIQISLSVIPFINILGWIIDRPITMLFDPFVAVVLFFSVLTVNYAVQDGRSNWLKGMILICLYVIAALMFYFYPGLRLYGLLTCPA
ncbi:calcium/proton exchanger [Thelephora ganbajun]|uniref:Calcium/proton exchanger n=1 Tax=Thelephora ganbajun TaxID=370292 RepID=A0ACB6ZRF1_THEGA|nr:calcium/proton exchanger [Thelephora ganbajun]